MMIPVKHTQENGEKLKIWLNPQSISAVAETEQGCLLWATCGKLNVDGTSPEEMVKKIDAELGDLFEAHKKALKAVTKEMESGGEWRE